MSKQTINIGASPNDGTGTPLRTSFDYTNQNFTEIYTALGGGVALPGATTQVIFNDGGTNLAGDAGLVYNKTTDALTVAGLVTAGSATITGDLTANGGIAMANSTAIASGGAVALYVDTNQVSIRARATNGITFQESTGANNLLTVSNAGVFGFLDGAGGTRMTLNSTGLGLGGVPSGVNRFAVFNGATQALTLDTSGNLLVGTATAFSTLTGSNQLRVNAGGLQTLSQAISAGIATDIATSGLGGLAVITGNNAAGQYSALVLFNFSSGATIVSDQNATGSVITYGISSGRLQVTSSLPLTTLITTCIRV